jgi:homoserine O-succinyltransferase
VLQPNTKLLRGFDDIFYAPHSRHTDSNREQIEQIDELEILAESPEAGIYIIARRDGRQIFVTGHAEYETSTLGNEYWRDKAKGLPIELPVRYFPNDDPDRPPVQTWRAHGNLLFSNWLNYYVYQETPYDRTQIQGR